MSRLTRGPGGDPERHEARRRGGTLGVDTAHATPDGPEHGGSRPCFAAGGLDRGSAWLFRARQRGALSPIDRIYASWRDDRIRGPVYIFCRTRSCCHPPHATSRYAFVPSFIYHQPSRCLITAAHTLLIISHCTLRFDIFVPHPGPWSFSTNLDEAHPRSTARR